MKYIIFQLSTGQTTPIIFPTTLIHKEVAECMRYMKEHTGGRDWHRPFSGATIVGAGFIDENGNCYGTSESLGVKSRPELDTFIVKSELKKR